MPTTVPGPETQTRRVAGAAGLTYVIGAGVENMDVLRAPTPASPAAEVRAHYADQALGIVTTAAGAIALVAYCVLTMTLFRLVRGDDRDGAARPWALAGVAAGLAGPAVAAVGVVAAAVLVADSGAGRSDDSVMSLFELSVDTRLISGVFIATFLAGFGVAALRSRALPAPLARAACVIAVPALLGPPAALADSDPLRAAAIVAFGGQSLWIFTTSLWLVLGDSVSWAELARRAAFLVLVVAAGLVGLAMLAAPGATDRFFAWDLAPEPLAAFAGGVYVGSAAVYAVAIPRPWAEVRALVAGAVVLSVSVFVATLVHLDVFDLDRLQAWAWLVLFAGFSLVTLGLLITAHPSGPAGQAPAARLQPWARALLAAVAAAGGALAAALWIDPVGLSDAAPFALPPLGGRFAGSWIALLAVLAGWAAARGRGAEARLPALALVALPAGALVAAARTSADLDAGGAGYAVVLVLLLACGLAVLRSLRRTAVGPAVSPSAGRP
jgi:hypothetical protein